MGKRTITERELRNIFPEWARISWDEQSNGAQILNSLSAPMEYLDKSLNRMGRNISPITANLDEIDLSYKVNLPSTFVFDTDTNDPTSPKFQPPTISGLSGATWYPVTLATNNDVESFWYTSTPNRATLNRVVSGVNHSLLIDTPASGYSVTGLWKQHLGGGSIWLETLGGNNYIQVTDGVLTRGRVVLHGLNSQGQEDQETIICPWDMKQKTFKDWIELYQIEMRDMEPEVEVSLTSANFNATDRKSPWNLRWSEHRNKVDEFWGLGTAPSGSSLQRIAYVSDEWQQLLQGNIDKEVKIGWELLDSGNHPISGVDMALQPFSDNAWVVTSSGMLYCFSTVEDVASGLYLLKDRTNGADIQLDIPYYHVTLGQDITFTPWHARPVKEIAQYTVWYQDPAGNKTTLIVPTYSTIMQRSITSMQTITPTMRGDYLLVLEATFVDGDYQIDKAIVTVESKTPLASIDIKSLISGNPVGIDFDTDQKLWILSSNGKYYQIDLHTDSCVIDYDNKVIYFHENYSSVGVTV